MAAKKKAAAPAETPKTEIVAKAPADSRIVAGQEIDAETALRNAKEAAVKEERTKVKADPDGDIDERMAALLKDHEAMGARPK